MLKYFERIVQKKSSGERIDVYLVKSGIGVSRSFVKNLIENGKIKVNGNIIKKSSYKVKEGDKIEVEFEIEERKEVIPQELPIDIIYEDDDLAVIYKPAGLVVHPARGHFTGTLVNALVFKYQELPVISDKTRPGIVHRLDKDTSGLLLIAKTDEAISKLGEMMERREIKRKYKLFAWGLLPLKKGIIEAPIGRDMVDRKKRAVTIFNSKPAITEYEVIETFDSFITFCEASLLTGRTHQIRVHFEHIGHPVVGDEVYSGRNPRKILSIIKSDLRELANEVLSIMQRQALHAFYLSFIHPIKNKKLEFEIDLPDDMKTLYEFLKEKFKK
jgi:23S rRNA pseudouridine1911/1915/1917 synthase